MDRFNVHSSTPEQIRIFCLPFLAQIEKIREEEEEDFEVVNQADELIDLIENILKSADEKNGLKESQIEIVKLTTEFKQKVRGKQTIMNIKGKSMCDQKDFDKAYGYFCSQIQKHHNSEPFKVNGVGGAARKNMDYLL